MKAYVQNGYGSTDFLSVKEVEKPNPKDNEILVKVRASSLNAGDYFSLMGSPWMIKFTLGFPRPKDHILGWDVSGVVESVGRAVSRFKPGDEVYTSCENAFAEYIRVEANQAAFKPSNLTFQEAAAVPTAAVTALIGIRDMGGLKTGQKLLVNGASGGVGTFAVQIGKAFGGDVTGVCSGKNGEMVKKIGADHVVDYSKDDFTKNKDGFDMILDNAASRKISDLKHCIKPGGVIIPNSGHGGMSYVIKAMLLKPFVKELGKMYLAVPTGKDLEFLKGLIEEGKIRPVVDKTYSFAKIPEAFDYMIKEHAKGKIVIDFEQ